MSMDTGDVLPPELSEILARLRADAHFMPPQQLKSVLSAEWGSDWLRDFRQFEVRPIAAASIGQVHRATLRDGRVLAVKVQYPGVARSIDSDVANVGALIRMSGLLPRGFEIAPYLDEARAQLHEEADYLAEAGHLERFGALLAGSPEFLVPELHAERTTRNVLTMSFVPGTAIEDSAEAAPDTRDRIATDLIRLLFRELFEFGLMQTDPNFANYRFDAGSGRIVLLDFGATRGFGAEVAAAYRRLMQAGLAGERDAVRRAAEDIGFLGPGIAPAHRDRILTMIELAFAAIREDEVFDFAETDLLRRFQAEGLALAEDGFVPPPLPMDVLYLQRKFAGIFLLASRLGARVPLRALVEAHLPAR
jgi:predicted unusual protein kinase regulating ubiquinone biosynthesis (AarF/ABC1/UbiB family)